MGAIDYASISYKNLILFISRNLMFEIFLSLIILKSGVPSYHQNQKLNITVFKINLKLQFNLHTYIYYFINESPRPGRSKTIIVHTTIIIEFQIFIWYYDKIYKKSFYLVSKLFYNTITHRNQISAVHPSEISHLIIILVKFDDPRSLQILFNDVYLRLAYRKSKTVVATID